MTIRVPVLNSSAEDGAASTAPTPARRACSIGFAEVSDGEDDDWGILDRFLTSCLENIERILFRKNLAKIDVCAISRERSSVLR